MIHQLVTILDAATAGLPVAHRHGLVELIEKGGVTVPAKFSGGKDSVNVASDLKGTWCYWRLTTPITSRPVQGSTVKQDQEVSFTIRMVAYVDRGGACSDAASVMAGIQNNVQANTLAMRQALSLQNATVGDVVVNLDTAAVQGQELAGITANVPQDRRMIAMDVRLTLRARSGCLPSCVDTVTVDVNTLNLN